MILLDTHIWIRWLLPTEPLPGRLVGYIEKADKVMISAISCWEVAMLVQKQRINIPLPISEWLEEATVGSSVDVLPITCQISQQAAILPEHHKDPADRIIIATAFCLNISLISFDHAFAAYQEVSNLLVQ